MSYKKFNPRHILPAIFLSFILVSCSTTSEPSGVAPEIFSADYYILKRPASADYKKLAQLSGSAVPATADGAALVLGFYYLRDGNIEMARPLIEKNYRSTALEPWLNRMGELWMMEIYLADMNLEAAQAQAAEVKSHLDEKGTEDALGRYCTIMRIYPPKGESYYSCVTMRLREFGVGTEAPRFEDEITGDLNILITGTGNMLDKAGGVYYYLRSHDLRHKVKIAKEYTPGDWDFWLDMDQGYLYGYGAGIYFKSDMAYYAARIDSFVPLDNCGTIILGMNTSNRAAASDLIKRLEAAGLHVKHADISDANVNRGLRAIFGPLAQEAEPFCAIGLGSEAEINNFVPTVRQYAETPSKQRIYTIVDFDSGSHYVSPYLIYYRGSYVYPLIDMTISASSIEFTENYKAYSGKEPIKEVFLGYDMMHFINKHSAEGVGVDSPYVSNIRLFHTDRVMREIRLYHVTSSGGLDRIRLDFDEDAFYGEDDLPDVDEPESGIGNPYL